MSLTTSSSTKKPRKLNRPKSKRAKKSSSLVTPAPTRKRKSARQEFLAWSASLPTQLERDTMLTPEWVAESVVQEVERFLNARLPENFVERLAAKTYYLYPRHKQFHKGLNGSGNRGREYLRMFMRHWISAWLKRERSPLHKKLPWSFKLGHPLPD